MGRVVRVPLGGAFFLDPLVRFPPSTLRPNIPGRGASCRPGLSCVSRAVLLAAEACLRLASNPGRAALGTLDFSRALQRRGRSAKKKKKKKKKKKVLSLIPLL